MLCYFPVLEEKSSDCCKVWYLHKTFLNLLYIHSNDFVSCLMISYSVFLSWKSKSLLLPAWKIRINIKVTTQKNFFIHNSYNNNVIVYLEFLHLKQWVCHKFVPDEAVVDEEILAKSEPSANLSKISTHML